MEGEESLLPLEVVEWAEISNEVFTSFNDGSSDVIAKLKTAHGFHGTLTEMNDDEVSFDLIANVIEAQL